MKIDLLIKEITDPAIQENFIRLKRELEAQPILQGNWQFYEVEIDTATAKFPYKHHLSFIPKDVVLLSVIGNYNVYFNYVDFDINNIFITTAGACRIRFLVGSFEKGLGSSKDIPFVAP